MSSTKMCVLLSRESLAYFSSPYECISTWRHLTLVTKMTMPNKCVYVTNINWVPYECDDALLSVHFRKY